MLLPMKTLRFKKLKTKAALNDKHEEIKVLNGVIKNNGDEALRIKNENKKLTKGAHKVSLAHNHYFWGQKLNHNVSFWLQKYC